MMKRILLLVISMLYICIAVADYGMSTMQLNVDNIKKDNNNNQIVQVLLSSVADKTPITLNDLAEAHTQKIHFFIVDDSLEDYAHIHPIATSTDGLYEFVWQPKKPNANYYIWADLLPVSTNKQEYIRANLYVSNKKVKPKINRSTVMLVTIQGYNFKLSFDNPHLKAGKAAMGHINITDLQGNPVTSLEPVMGSFSHIVGISEDLKTVVHIHPIGVEPTSISDRGGPELEFHLNPEQAGFIKIFAHIKMHGKDFYVPFGVNVLE